MYPSSRELPPIDPIGMTYDEMLFSFTEEDFKSEISFIGSEPLKIKTANAQEFYNLYQLYPKVIMFDMRSRTNYSNCQLKCSLNLPVDIFKPEDFINFNPKKIMDEYLNLDYEKEMFKNRKKSIVFIVSHRVCTTHIFPYLHYLFDPDKIQALRYKFAAEDILATKNCILLYCALKKDKTREVYICRNSFNALQSKYPFMCRFKGSSLYLEPKKSNGYPSEIIDRRLYLGDKSHAENETVLMNLGITHILNVTHNIPNTFEESKNLRITYKRISVEDSADVPIELSFNLAYEFIESAFCKKKSGKTRLVSTQFDLLQNFQDSRKKSMILVSGAAMTNDIILDLNSKTFENVENRVKDQIYEIDTTTTYNMQNSNNQNRVLVHCAMGRSRSATMVIMYLMRKFEIDCNLALDIVKMRREIIDPNEGFLK